MAFRVIGQCNRPEDLQSLARLAERESYRKEAIYQTHTVYDLLRSTALFKAQLQSINPDMAVCHDQKIFLYRVRSWDFNNGQGTIAVSKRSHSVRYIVGTSTLIQDYITNNSRSGKNIPPETVEMASRVNATSKSLPYSLPATPNQLKSAPGNA
jgi:hypothetical protein